MTKNVVIVGAGPAGIFCGLGLIYPTSGKKVDYNVSLFEKGKPIESRYCPGNHNKICNQSCEPCSQMCGFGGAGAFSDGKLNISTSALGDVRITNYVPNDDFVRMVQLVDRRWVMYGAPERVFGEESDITRNLVEKFKKVNLDLLVGRIRHVGSELTKKCLEEMQSDLQKEMTLNFQSEVDQIVVEGKGDKRKVTGVILKDGTIHLADYVIICPGREGKVWFEKECDRLGIEKEKHAVDVGVRVEIPKFVLEHLTSVLYEPKIFCRPSPFNDQTRTFCVCPGGRVTLETITGYDGSRLSCVNGHSFGSEELRTENTNFALLVKSNFIDPFDQPTEYATAYASKANMLAGGGVLVQRLGDIIAGRRSTQGRISESRIKPSLELAVPGDLGYAIPYRIMVNLIETLRIMESIAPGIYSMVNTLLYGPEIKFYSSTPKVIRLEVDGIEGLYVGGDGVGISRNLVHAAVCGLWIAEQINDKNTGNVKHFWGG